MKYESVSCKSNGTGAVITPLTPPITKRMMKPTMKRNGTLKTGRPYQIVASHATIDTPLGIVTVMLAPLKNDMANCGSPVANMWWTHTPEPTTPVATVANATKVYPASGRRQKVGIMSDASPIAGSTTM